MKLFLLLGGAILMVVGCGKNTGTEESDSHPVSGSYGDAGRAAGVRPTENDVTDTNLLTSPSNTLHRVAK